MWVLADCTLWKLHLRCSFWGSWLPGRLWRVSGWRLRLDSEAEAYHPGILWERWPVLTGSFRGGGVVPGSQPAVPLFLPTSRQVVWALPSVGDGNYVVASHILWYVCPMVSTFQTQIWYCDAETLALKVLFWFLWECSLFMSPSAGRGQGRSRPSRALCDLPFSLPQCHRWWSFHSLLALVFSIYFLLLLAENSRGGLGY